MVSDYLRKLKTGTGEARPLRPSEIALVPPDFAAVVDLRAVRLIDRVHNPFAAGKVLVRGPDIYWPGTPADLSRCGLRTRALFVHELAHVWQYATGRLSAWRYLTTPSDWRYGYEVRQGAGFDDYGVEAQADMVGDWYRMREGAAPVCFRMGALGEPPTLDWLEATIPFARPRSLRG